MDPVSDVTNPTVTSESTENPTTTVKPTITERARACNQQFKDLKEALRKDGVNCVVAPYTKDIYDLNDRYSQWTGNLGALQPAEHHLSLDHRLQNTKLVRDAIYSTLVDLFESLQILTEYANGEREVRISELWAIMDAIENGEKIEGLSDSESSSTFSDSSDDDLLDPSLASQRGSLPVNMMKPTRCPVEATVSTARTGVESLFRAAIFVRKFSSAIRRERAAGTKPFDNKADIAHIRYLFKNISMPFATRLGEANARRRQYFKYRRDHHGKQGNVVEEQERPTVVEIPVQEAQTAANSEGNSTPAQEPANRNPETLAQPTLLVSTRVTEILPTNIGMLYSRARSVVSTSVASSAMRLGYFGDLADKFPSIPMEARSGLPFLCPYCFTIVGSLGPEGTGIQMKKWRQHVIQDLEPYICTFSSCGVETFRSERDWFEHELLSHRLQWHCSSCSRSDFTSAKSFGRHASECDPELRLKVSQAESGVAAHKQDLRELLDIVVQSSQSSVRDVDPAQCPFCCDDLWAKRSGTRTNVPPESHDTTQDVTAMSPPGEYLSVSADDFRIHVGEHFQEVALFALPKRPAPGVDDGKTVSSRADDGTRSSMVDLDYVSEPPLDESSHIEIDPTTELKATLGSSAVVQKSFEAILDFMNHCEKQFEANFENWKLLSSYFLPFRSDVRLNYLKFLSHLRRTLTLLFPGDYFTIDQLMENANDSRWSDGTLSKQVMEMLEVHSREAYWRWQKIFTERERKLEKAIAKVLRLLRIELDTGEGPGWKRIDVDKPIEVQFQALFQPFSQGRHRKIEEQLKHCVLEISESSEKILTTTVDCPDTGLIIRHPDLFPEIERARRNLEDVYQLFEHQSRIRMGSAEGSQRNTECIGILLGTSYDGCGKVLSFGICSSEVVSVDTHTRNLVGFFNMQPVSTSELQVERAESLDELETVSTETHNNQDTHPIMPSVIPLAQAHGSDTGSVAAVHVGSKGTKQQTEATNDSEITGTIFEAIAYCPTPASRRPNGQQDLGVIMNRDRSRCYRVFSLVEDDDGHGVEAKLTTDSSDGKATGYQLQLVPFEALLSPFNDSHDVELPAPAIPVPLDQILEISRNFVSGILQVASSSWLDSNWSRDNFYFSVQGSILCDSRPIILPLGLVSGSRAALDEERVMYSAAPGAELQSKGSETFTRQSMFKLGVILLELLFGHALPRDLESGTDISMKEAKKWLQMVVDDLRADPDLFTAIQRCIECDFAAQPDFKSPEFRKAVYDGVIKPLFIVSLKFSPVSSSSIK